MIAFQMKMDADHFNEINSDKEPIEPILNFIEDVAEREALEKLDRKAS